jgi:hypothetical protein
MTSFAVRYAAARGQSAYVLFGSDDQIFNTTRATLSFALDGNGDARSNSIEVPKGDRVRDYRSRIASLKPNFIEVAQRNPASVGAGISPRHVVIAMQSLRYRRVDRFTLPDGRHAELWYRRQPTLMQTAARVVAPRR